MKVSQSVKFDQEWKEVSEKQREVYAAFIGVTQIRKRLPVGKEGKATENMYTVKEGSIITKNERGYEEVYTIKQFMDTFVKADGSRIEEADVKEMMKSDDWTKVRKVKTEKVKALFMPYNKYRSFRVEQLGVTVNEYSSKVCGNGDYIVQHANGKIEVVYGTLFQFIFDMRAFPGNTIEELYDNYPLVKPFKRVLRSVNMLFTADEMVNMCKATVLGKNDLDIINTEVYASKKNEGKLGKNDAVVCTIGIEGKPLFIEMLAVTVNGQNEVVIKMSVLEHNKDMNKMFLLENARELLYNDENSKLSNDLKVRKARYKVDTNLSHDENLDACKNKLKEMADGFIESLSSKKIWAIPVRKLEQVFQKTVREFFNKVGVKYELKHEGLDLEGKSTHIFKYTLLCECKNICATIEYKVSPVKGYKGFNAAIKAYDAGSHNVISDIPETSIVDEFPETREAKLKSKILRCMKDIVCIGLSEGSDTSTGKAKTFVAVGRIFTDNTLAGFTLRGENGERDFTIEQCAYLCGRGRIENIKMQLNSGDVVWRMVPEGSLKDLPAKRVDKFGKHSTKSYEESKKPKTQEELEKERVANEKRSQSEMIKAIVTAFKKKYEAAKGFNREDGRYVKDGKRYIKFNTIGTKGLSIRAANGISGSDIEIEDTASENIDEVIKVIMESVA